jgi:hypothetical protein
MKKTLLLLLCAASLLLIRCGNDPSSTKLPKLNITDATSLVVYGDNSNARLSTSTDGELYKVTTEGGIEVVKFINDNGSDAKGSMDIDAIYEIDNDYLVMNGDFRAGNQQLFSLLVRKKDGAIFDFGNPYQVDQSPKYCGSMGPYQSDGYGNAYYNFAGGIVKATLTEDTEISISDYTYTGQFASNFAIDAKGNCIYTSLNDNVKVRKYTGGMTEFGYSRNYWVGANGKIYYVGNGPTTTINTLTVNDDGTVSEDTVWTSPSWETSGFYGANINSTYLIRQNNSTLFIDSGVISKFNEDTNMLSYYSLFPMSDLKKIVHSVRNFYVADGTKLFKVSLQDYTYKSILTEGQYQIYNMSVDENDLLQISALRYSDGKKILAQIDNGGVFTVLDEETNQAATILQRLN